MRTLNKFLTISAMAFLFMLMAPHESMAQGYVSNQEFYDDLQDYGTWIQDDQYGDVWVPDVDGDFRPYATDGHWVQTDYGTTWVSDYPWGWATFHYGRWRFDDYYGWEWIPGHEWAPAWVTWRQGGGYYSWAPMQPGISVSVTLGGGYYVPDRYWVCAPQAYITSPYINRYYVPDARAITIVRNTTYIRNTYIYNNRTYITGPRPRDIQHVTHQRVTVYHIGNANRPGTANFNRNVVNFYRPEIQVTVGARPRRVVDARAYRTANPHDGIGKPGVTINIHINAAKLAATARSNNPKVVHVNPVPVHDAMPGDHKSVGPVLPGKSNTLPNNTHPAMPDNHKNAGPVNHGQQQPAADNKNPRKVAPAVMPPADHHDPTVRQSQPAEQQKQQADEAAGQQKEQQQQKVKADAQQAAQQQKMQQQEVEKQQQKAQAQQASQQKQQQQQAEQQARQQAQQQSKAQAQQAAQQQKQQQQQAAQQARQQEQQQQKQQQQQAQQQARQQAQQQQRQQQQAAQQAAREAAQKQKQQDQQKQQNPPGN